MIDNKPLIEVAHEMADRNFYNLLRLSLYAGGSGTLGVSLLYFAGRCLDDKPFSYALAEGSIIMMSSSLLCGIGLCTEFIRGYLEEKRLIRDERDFFASYNGLESRVEEK
jgi:hypothetical protein